MLVLWALAALGLGICSGDQLADDSLQGALEAINRRQRDLADPTLYYLEHFHPSRNSYPHQDDGDGQPEDIGYGYQKSFAPKTAGVFEAIPLPERELGSHDPGVQTHTPNDKSFENVILDYIEDNMGNPVGIEPQRFHYANQNENNKRSVFRERDVNELPSSLQNLYIQGDPEQYFENGEHSHVIPSSFRERLSSKLARNHPARNAQSLVRSFGGLNRDTDNLPENYEDPDEYLTMLNSVWEKYQDSNPENVDPEDLSESDVEEILSYLAHKQERKRQYDDSYENGFDYFNSPFLWNKRSRQRLVDNPKHNSHQFLHALKFLNSHPDTLESLRDEDVPDEERDADVAKLLLETQGLKSAKQYKKRFWRGNTYEEHHHAKRYPIAKRSPSFYTSPALLYHKHSAERFNQRRKKNVRSSPPDGMTDPKVAKELNNIFSSSDNTIPEKSTPNNTEKNHTKISNTEIHSNKTLNKPSKTSLPIGTHIQWKRSGQKEEPSVDIQHQPLQLIKKSVDWSDYFGIDRRRKKSSMRPGNDEWLLDQYLKAYTVSARIGNANQIKDGDHQSEESNKDTDDIDAKLRAMEDMIVDQALKYTGAHEGVTGSEEVQEVKDRVISQLAAAYSLEKMRKALGEFKSSMAAQKEPSPAHSTTTNAPTDLPEQKDKRVAIKKEKAEIPPDEKFEKKDDSDNKISAVNPSGFQHSQMGSSQEDSCPVMSDITNRCKQVAQIAGDTSEALVPLCNLHQVCYLCGSEMATPPSGCDVTFLSEANSLCGGSPRCRYTVRRALAAIRSLRGDPSPVGCDWQTHPCLANYLALTMR